MNVIAKDCWTKRLSLLLTIMLLLSLAAPAFAAETAHAGPFVVTERHAYNVAQGVQETELHLNTTDGDEQNLAHVMEIDLSDPTVSLRAGYKNYDGSHWGLQTVPEQVAAAEPHFREQNAAANVVGAINGCYYNMATGEPLGALVIDGQTVHTGNKIWAYFAVHANGTVEFLSGDTAIPSDVVETVPGKHWLVRGGSVYPLHEAERDTSVWYNDAELRAPRTAIGIKADGSVILFETDGRQAPASRGMTYSELAAMMLDLGCRDALMLDGGGSACFYTKRPDDMALTRRNIASGGYDRPVASTLMVVSTADLVAPAPQQEQTTWVYDPANDALTSTDGQQSVPLASYSGRAVLSGTDSEVYLIAGKVQTGWIACGYEMLHADADGVLHQTTTTQGGRSCTTNGRCEAVCDTCGETYTGDSVYYHTGHVWDANHICTVCGRQGTDIASLSLTNVGDTYLYTSEGVNVKPTPTITDGGKTLELTASTDGADGCITWENYWQIGTARVIVHGNGDYYGTIEKTYRIVPNRVPDVKFGKTTATTAEISWLRVPGADQYVISKYDYKTKQLVELAVVSGSATSVTLGGLLPDTTYSICVRGRKTVDGETFDSYNYAWIYPKTLTADSSAGQLTDVSADVGEKEQVHLQNVDGNDYLFLPSCADLNQLSMTFTLSGEGKSVRLIGNKGSVKLDALNGQVDLVSLATENEDGCYVIGVSVDDMPETPVYVMHASVPALFLHSADPDTQGRSYVDASKEHKAKGSMLLLNADGSTIYDGALTQIKARGNTTFSNSPKKAYQIKLDSKTDLIGIAGKGKTWVLLAGYTDATQLHDKMLKDLAAELDMPYVPRNDWVDLYYDGEYRGIYLLGEKNSIGGSAIDIADLEDAYENLNEGYGDDPELMLGENRFGQEFRYTEGLQDPENLTGGYLIELNNTQYDEACGFKTVQGVGMNVKTPEFASADAVRYISEYYQEFENAVYAQDEAGNFTGLNAETGKYYYEYVDLQSLVQMYLIQEFGANVDGFYSSFYFYKDADGIMYAGPIWDQDSTFGTGWSGVVPSDLDFTSSRYLAKALIQIPSFQKVLVQYYNETFRPQILTLLGENGTIAKNSSYIRASVGMNYKLWPFVRVGNPNKDNHLYGPDMNYPTAVQNLERWVTERIAWMDARYPASSDTPTTPTQPTMGDPTQPNDPSEPQEPTEPTVPSVPTGNQDPIPTAPTVLPYQDLDPNAYYYDAVAWAHKAGITTGVAPNLFAPEADCTRAQIVTFLWRSAGSPEPHSLAGPFTDVEKGSYYEKAVAWAIENNITNGTSATTFSPDAPATRAHAVTFLFRLTQAKPVSEKTPFSDVEPGAYYADAVGWAYANQIVNGMTETTFGPDIVCQRAHIVTLLFRNQTNI